MDKVEQRPSRGPSTMVALHGVGNQQKGPRQLAPLWQAALQDGLEFACGHRVAPPVLELAFYGHLFLPDGDLASARKGPAGDRGDWLLQLDQAELEDLAAAAAEMVSDEELAQAGAEEAKAHTRVPRPLQVVLRAMDRRFGPSAGVLHLGELRQVRRYLTEPETKAQVDEIVRAAVPQDCRALIGHSLGTVVAFEYVRQNPDHPLDLLLTLGSPLGLRMVRRLMPDPQYGASTGLPPNVRTWANIRDPRDPVACAGDLGRWWPGVDDRPPVDNQGDAHSVERYLGKRETGAAVLAALPGLADV